MIILTLILLLTILVNLLILFYVNYNENKECDCSNTLGWKRDYIKKYQIISLFIIFIIYVLPLILRLLKQKSMGIVITQIIRNPWVNFLISVFIALGFFNIYFIFKYTTEIQKNKCNCLDDNKLHSIVNTGLFYYSIFVMVFYIITTMISISLKQS
tara:strand:- start:6 stop:473 length:468 start_codon:yes stop_codon:yes gene_type:complete